MHISLAKVEIIKDNLDPWDKLSEVQKNSVKKAQLELSGGLGKPHKEVMKKYKKSYL